MGVATWSARLTLLALHEQDSPDSSYAAIADAMNVHGVSGQIAADRRSCLRAWCSTSSSPTTTTTCATTPFSSTRAAAVWRLSPLVRRSPEAAGGAGAPVAPVDWTAGRLARLDNAMAGAGRFGLLPPDAARIVDRVVRHCAAGVRPLKAWACRWECDKVATAFRRAADIGMRDVERCL